MFYSPLQKSGFKPGLALQSSIPRLLMAAAVLGGSGLMVSTGSAQAATYACSPDPAQGGKVDFLRIPLLSLTKVTSYLAVTKDMTLALPTTVDIRVL
jgi:hypothetical protein